MLKYPAAKTTKYDRPGNQAPMTPRGESAVKSTVKARYMPIINVKRFSCSCRAPIMKRT